MTAGNTSREPVLHSPVSRLCRRAGFVVLALSACAIAYGAPPASAIPSDAKKTVLVLAAERGELPTTAILESALRDELTGEAGKVEIFVEHLDLGRFPGKLQEQELVRHLAHRYSGQKIDVVVPLFEAAFEFALAQRAQLFPGVPIVAVAIDQNWLARRILPAGVAAVSVAYDYRRTIGLMRALDPKIQQVVIVHGVGDFDLRLRDEARQALENSEPKLSYRFVSALPLSVIEDEVRRLPSTSAILLVSMVREAEGRPYVGRDFAARLAAVSPVPVFGTFESHLARGALGVAMTDFAATGREAAAVVNRVFADNDASNLRTVEPAATLLRVNWQALQRWHIPESRVPPGVQILYRPPSMWDQHGITIVVILFAIVLQGLVITDLIIELKRRKRVEQTLRESEARFRTMADTAPVLIWMSGPDKLCTFFNKGWLDFTGRGLEQELGNGWAQGVHPEDFDRCLATYNGSFEARRQFTMEYRLKRRDGEYRWVQDDGVPRLAADGRFLGYIGSCIDLTERRRAEERLRLAVAGLPIAIVMVNKPGVIVLANAQAERLFGYEEGKLVGTAVDMVLSKPVHDVRTAQHPEFLGPTWTQSAWTGRNARAIRKDGSELMVEIELNPIEVEDGMLMMTAIIDVTERNELQRSRQELLHVTRVSTMGELAGSLAHELNQPITAILSNTQAIQRFMNADSSDLTEVRAILVDVVQESKRAGEVIRRMRALVKKGELEVVPLDPGAMTRDVVALLKSDAIIRGVHPMLDIVPNLPLVRGDRVQLQQVMLNLLLNAFDAMKDRPQGERVVRVGVAPVGDDGVRIAVHDRGTGLTGDKLDHIFQPFFTTKHDGLGLGLSISRSIIEAHGSRLRAENNAGRGATFYFTLPVADAAYKVHAGEST